MGQIASTWELFTTLVKVLINEVYKSKQEAQGPHHSPEKTVQINKHMYMIIS